MLAMQEIIIPVMVVMFPAASIDTVLALLLLCLLNEKSEMEMINRNNRLPVKSNHVSVKEASLQKMATVVQ